MSFLACAASVSVGFSARSRQFSLFGGGKIGASATLMEKELFKKRKVLQTCGKPNGNACYAGYLVLFFSLFLGFIAVRGLVFNMTIILLGLSGYQMMNNQLGVTHFSGYSLFDIQRTLVE